MCKKLLLLRLIHSSFLEQEQNSDCVCRKKETQVDYVQKVFLFFCLPFQTKNKKLAMFVDKKINADKIGLKRFTFDRFYLVLGVFFFFFPFCGETVERLSSFEKKMIPFVLFSPFFRSRSTAQLCVQEKQRNIYTEYKRSVKKYGLFRFVSFDLPFQIRPECWLGL